MPLLELTDLDDPRLADYRDLTDVALRSRIEPEGGLYIAESAKVIGRAVAAGHRPRSVLLARGWLDRMGPLLDALLAEDPELPVLVADEPVVSGIAGFRVHRGALAAMHRPPLPPFEAVVTPTARRVVLLEGVVDHTNVGAILRSVAGVGADAAIVADDSADPLYRRSVRVSMGAVFLVPWTRLPAGQAVARLQAAGLTVAALALDPSAIDLDALATDPPERLAIVLGSEGDGLSRRTVAAADVVVRIPMAGGVDSLNVAAASALALWALRPRTGLAPSPLP